MVEHICGSSTSSSSRSHVLVTEASVMAAAQAAIQATMDLPQSTSPSISHNEDVKTVEPDPPKTLEEFYHLSLERKRSQRSTVSKLPRPKSPIGSEEVKAIAHKLGYNEVRTEEDFNKLTEQQQKEVVAAADAAHRRAREEQSKQKKATENFVYNKIVSTKREGK